MTPLFATSVRDAWLLCGAAPETQNTWDLSINDNLAEAMTGNWRQIRHRFDRVFVNAQIGAANDKPRSRAWRLTEFSLLGKQRLPDALFPSDHFGVRCCFSIDPN
jgi:hypothetical protein